jgi:proton-translocating NADH-quinone oxidoreductase chain M
MIILSLSLFPLLWAFLLLFVRSRTTVGLGIAALIYSWFSLILSFDFLYFLEDIVFFDGFNVRQVASGEAGLFAPDFKPYGFLYFLSFRLVGLLNLNYTLGVDGISIWFIFLTNFLIVICVWLGIESISTNHKWFYVLLFLTQSLLVHVFSFLDLVLFYISFEAVLIPVFLLILVWGSRERKIHAAYQFFLYTLVGSFFFLLALFYTYSIEGTTDFFVLLERGLDRNQQLLLGGALFLACAVKIPLFPLHIWLPEAHVEAPTAGSVLLAGILLKMGGYGLLRFLLPLCPYFVESASTFIYVACVIGVFYTGFTTLRQIDMKKIIAYSSVGHMSFVVCGLISGNFYGLEGALYLMVTHGLVSPALFLCVGVLYDRYGSRLFSYYGGLTMIMPIFALFFHVFILANFSLPGTCSFVAELLVILGLVFENFWIAALLFLSGALGVVYSLWLFNRVAFGPFNLKSSFYVDLSNSEFFFLGLLAFLVIFLGIYPEAIMQDFELPVARILFYSSRNSCF